MCQDTLDHLKINLVALLARDGKKAIYWKNDTTISMTEDVAILLYKILGMENGGWTKIEEGCHLNGCSCTTARIINKNGTAFGKANKQITYRDFQPCSTHASEIFELFKQANISTKEQDRNIKIKNSPRLPTQQEIVDIKNDTSIYEYSNQSLCGWHDGVHVFLGGLCDGRGRR
jgi:hypothetical protein